MEYKEAVSYIDGLIGMRTKHGLERIKRLLERLGNPQNNLKIIHVAGTNGKGSTCAMLLYIFMEAGYKTGMYTSPHLERYNERFVINGVSICDSDFSKIIERIKNCCDAMAQQKEGQPTIFEVLTAAAFVYFNETGVDYVLLEVGLGGRLDATNVIKSPVLSIITEIGFDHMEYLGNTLKEIAAEKGGIIKENCPVVLHSQNKVVYNIVQDICKSKNAALYYAEHNEFEIIKQDLYGTIFSVKNEYYSYESIKLRLLGQYQIYNAATVLLAHHALMDRMIPISKESVTQGLSKALWAGRMEICGKSPLLLLDGAHNYDGIVMLSKSLKQYFNKQKITLLLGILEDKQYKKMIDCMIPLAEQIIITEPHSKRKLTVERLKEIVNGCGKPVKQCKDLKQALCYAKKNTLAENVVCCVGSLYMVGEIKAVLNHEKSWDEF